MTSLEVIIGGIVVIITALMPVIMIVLKIQKMHELINRRFAELLDANSKVAMMMGKMELEIQQQTQVNPELEGPISAGAAQAKAILEEATTKAKKIMQDAAQESLKKY